MTSNGWFDDLEFRRLDAYRWLIPRQGRMRTEGLLYADEGLMSDIRGDQAARQVANVACLPGIVGRSIGMPDMHWGYGFAIGGVAAFDPDEGGVVSPGGVGYDINCGVRLMRTDLQREEIRPRLDRLMDRLARDIPAGVGSEVREYRLGDDELEEVLATGAAWAVSKGLGIDDDLARIESGGALGDADPGEVSSRARSRGRKQLGTVGSGNHFVELGWVDEVYDDEAARAFGLEAGTVTVMIHSGSRGLGHQVCTDFLDVMLEATRRYGIDLPDRQLACAPLDSPEAGRYLAAMAAAANYAFANRQVMGHRVREAFARTFDRGWIDMGVRLVYDVAHNNAKWEEHDTGDGARRLCIHRKGATRAFPPRHPDLGPAYTEVGQPVLIPGDMGRYSYVLAGTAGAYRETFGSTCHGAGRRMSEEFDRRGIEVRAASFGTVAEEVPEAYKDVADVVDVVDAAGIGRKVARLRPLGVLKG